MQNARLIIGSEEFITPRVIQHVESVARGLVGQSALDSFNFEDICQEFYNQIVRAAENYDPSKGAVYTYVCRAVDRYKNRILRDRIKLVRTRRDYREYLTEDDLIDNSAEKAILVNDVRQVISELPPKYRVFCECLLDGKSMRKAAETAGFTWGTEIQSTVLPFLRKKFRELRFF